MTISVRPISSAEHKAFVDAVGVARSVSFLQTPAWAAVKPEWRGESLGWYRDGALVGVGLVLYRSLPKIGRSLAYLPEGPVIDWAGDDVAEHLGALAEHARRAGAFGVRIGPTVVRRRWNAEAIKSAIADESIRSLDQVAPTEESLVATRVHNTLRHAGWLPPKPEGEGFAAGQPRMNFWLPLTHADGTPKTADELSAGMNQLWRRNIKKATKSGVTVRRGAREDLAAFHGVYVETAERDGFTPRPLAYFETMWDALCGEDPDRLRLYLAEHEGDLVAATTWVRVGRHAWYSYGASTNAKRDVRGSNAIQWQMMSDALAAGAEVYDLRGITDSVATDDPHLGLIQFKVGTGGEAVEYLGEWDLPLNAPLYRLFDAYMNRGVVTTRVRSALGWLTGLAGKVRRRSR